MPVYMEHPFPIIRYLRALPEAPINGTIACSLKHRSGQGRVTDLLVGNSVFDWRQNHILGSLDETPGWRLEL